MGELIARAGLKVSFIDPKFPVQTAFIQDKSKKKLANCTRRAGKSRGVAKEMLQTAVDEAKTTQVFFALTLDSAREIIWDILEEECDKKGIKYNPHKQAGIFELMNGSRIRLFGVDSSYKEMRKVLGQKIRRAVIDETGSMTIDMQTLIYQMIMPALTDLNGEIILCGTCENIPNTFFQQCVEGKDPGWSKHLWTTYDNPYLKDNWTKEINRILTENPLAKDASWFQTHYLNKWMMDDDLLAYKLGPQNYGKMIKGLSYNYVLGVDLGYNDDSSFVVGAYSFDDPIMRVVESFKSPEMDFTDVALKIKEFSARYPIVKTIVDGANKQGIQEMVRRHQIPLENADKHDKVTFMRMMRDDLIQGKLVIDGDLNTALISEMLQLQWKDKTKQEEDPRCQNHLLDALLYIHRYCYNYIHKQEVKKCPTDQERMEMEMRREMEEMRKEQEEREFLM